MICKKCGKLCNDSSKFCPYCGQKAEEQIPVGGAQTNIPVNTYYNAGAGNPVYNNGGYGNAGNVKSKEKNRNKKVIPVVIAVVAVIALLAGGIALMVLPAADKKTDGPVDSWLAETGKSEEDADASEEIPPQEPDNNAAAQASVSELLGYVDQAEQIIARVYSDYLTYYQDESLDELEMFRQQTIVLGDALPELLSLQQKAQTVSGMDAKLGNASKAYFNMVCDSQKAFYEMWVFMSDVLEFCELLEDRPEAAYYDFLDDYYNDLYSWYVSTKEEYSAIDSCPSCLETKWKQYGDVLDLNESIAYKMYDADMFEDDYDYLRLYSALNMMDRYDVVEYNQTYELLDCMEGEMDHFLKQKDVAYELAEEIHAYAELGETERGSFEFQNVMEGEIYLNYDAIDVIYPSLYNTYDAFLIVKTGCVSGTRKIVVEAEIQGFTQKYKEIFTLDPSYTEIYIKPPALTGDLQLASAKDAQISVTISEQDGTLIDAKTFPISIKSKYDVEWYTDEYGVATQDNILCFLTPESSAIAELKRLAIDEMSGMTNGTVESFAGYQNVTPWSNYVYTYLQAAGIMRAMYEMGIRYNMDPFSLSGSNQHVLFPEDVISQKSGLCIETSLLVASALQSAGMHVFLVLPPRHAQVAVETWSGSGQYFLIETTALSSSSNSRQIYIDIGNQLISEGTMAYSGTPIMYLTSSQWNEYLSVDGTYIIDCDDSRILGLTQFTN